MVKFFGKSPGRYFSTNEEQAIKQNTNKKIDKIRKLAKNWNLQRLTLVGKITITSFTE